MNEQDKKNTGLKIARYAAVAAILIILASFGYQWYKGYEIDSTETFGFAFAIIIFVSTFFPTRKKDE